MTQYLSLEDILRLHYLLIEDFGGSHGVRDEERLKSVLVAPSQMAFGIQQYPAIYEKAAVYLRNIIADHTFADGNKRTAITVTGVFLRRNAILMTAKPTELEDLAVQVAVEHLDITTIAAWLETHSRPV